MIETPKEPTRVDRVAAGALKPPHRGIEGEAKGEGRDNRSKLRFVVMLGAFLGIGAVAAYLAGLWHETAEQAVPEIVPIQTSVVGLGYLEPASTVLDVSAPTNSDSSRIAELRVAEGEEVEAGTVLAVLDTAPRLRAQLDLSTAQVELKRLQLQKQQLEIAYNIESRRSALDRARADLASAKTDYQRQQTLIDRKVVSRSVLDKTKRDYLNALATVREMEAGLRRVNAKVALGKRSTQDTPIDVAVTALELTVAEAELVVAKANLDQAVVRAPVDGVVLAINSRVGERIGSDGLLEMGSTSDMRAVVEVHQTDIRRIRIGQKVTLSASALNTPVPGTVERVGVIVKRQTVVNNDPASATDSRVVEVRVTLAPEASRQVAALSRLQVLARFE